MKSPEQAIVYIMTILLIGTLVAFAQRPPSGDKPNSWGQREAEKASSQRSMGTEAAISAASLDEQLDLFSPDATATQMRTAFEAAEKKFGNFYLNKENALHFLGA